MTDTIECPGCLGRKVTGRVHITREDGSHEWRESMPCHVCDGAGRIEAAHADRIVWGRELRRMRQARDLSLMEAARKVGITAAQFSAIEHGRTEPDSDTVYALAMADLLPDPVEAA